MSGRNIIVKFECSIPGWDEEKQNWKFPNKKATVAFKTKEKCNASKDATDEQLEIEARKLVADFKKEMSLKSPDFLYALMLNLLKQIRVYNTKEHFDEINAKQETHEC